MNQPCHELHWAQAYLKMWQSGTPSFGLTNQKGYKPFINTAPGPWACL